MHTRLGIAILASLAATACGGGGSTATATVTAATSGSTPSTTTGSTSGAGTTTTGTTGTTTAGTTTSGTAGTTGTTSTTGSSTTGSTASGTTITTNASTAGVLCSYATNVFNTSPSVNATAFATWSCSGTKRMLVANGLPDHTVGTFPNANNPNTITAQSVSASDTLSPQYSGTATAMGGATTIAYVLNGVKMDPNTAGSCDNSGSNCTLIGNTGNWSIEALGESSFNFGVDSNNAHVQPGGVYHYHGIPEGFVTKLGKGQAMTLIAWAADGFPIYARYGYTVASDATSALKVIKASYRVKATPDANRPSTSLYPMGTFKQDYEYVAGLGDLDECNGRTGVTPEFPNGTYHYYATDTYPYLQRCVKGVVAP